MTEWIPATEENVLKHLCGDVDPRDYSPWSPLHNTKSFDYLTDQNLILTQCHILKIKTKSTGKVDEELEDIVEFDHLVATIPFTTEELRITHFKTKEARCL